jgi:hypothetical protein
MMEENLENTFATDPYRQMGSYVKRCLGVNIYIKIENPMGSRIQQFFVGGEDLDRRRNYAVAFVTTQGVPEQYGHNRRELDVKAVDSLRDYFSKHDRIKAEFRGTVVAV